MSFINAFLVFGSSNVFISTWDTTKIVDGGSDANSVILPISNMIGLEVDWGDGVKDSLNTHTYATGGVKVIKIRGEVDSFRSANAQYDRQKLMSIQNWGDFTINNTSTFGYCPNLNLSEVIGVPKITTTNLESTFEACANLTSVRGLTSWSTVNVDSFRRMFYGCTKFNQNINELNVSSGQDFRQMFFGGSLFNSPLNLWEITNATQITQMLANCNAWNQNIGNWNVENVTNATNFLQGKTTANFSTANLDAIYNGWSTMTLKTGVDISFGSAKYTTASQAGRDILTTTYGWTITDGGI